MHRCPFSSCTFISSTVALVLSHLRAVHSSDPRFSVCCGIGGCAATLKSFRSLYQHIYRKHRDSGIISRRCVQPEEVGSVLPSSEIESISLLADSNDNDSGNLDLDYLLGTDKEIQQKTSALFILKLKETHRLSQVAIDDIIEGYQGVFDFSVQRMRCGVNASIANAGIDPTDVPRLEHVFTDLVNPFNGLETYNKQESYFRDKLDLLESIEISIGDARYEPQFSGHKRRLVERRDSFQYIPFLESLQRLLSLDSVVEQIEAQVQRTDGILADFCDGSLYKSHPLFSVDSSALQIIAYFDELEICNPLGTRTKKHKLGIVLYTLGNISPKFRSRLISMNLVAVATTPVIEKHGLDAILKPFLDDISKLSAGCEFVVRGKKQLIKGGLLCFLADNLASNALGEFKESFSFSYRFCRTCMVPTQAINTCISTKDMTLRNDANHELHCQELQGSLSGHYSKTYGINRRSSLMDVPNYSIFGGGLPHDIMHDIFEGVAQYEIKLLLKHCISNSYFSLNDYNHRLLYFDYGFSETDKPSPLTQRTLQSDDKKLHLSASQTILLCRVLPFIIGDKVPEGNEVWHCFLLLLKIVDLVLSPCISIDNCGVLKVLIEEHLQTFMSVFPGATVIPKIHLMLHYAVQIVSIGPMTCSWTMRQEAKLSFFKKASHLGNFKNIACTLARRHQRWMCYQLASGSVFESCIECGPGAEPHELASEPATFRTELQLHFPCANYSTMIYRPSWVKTNGITYKANNAYCVIGVKDNEPEFGRVLDIIVLGGDTVVFHVQCCDISYYDEHFHSYVIALSPNQKLMPLSKLLSPFILHGHILFDGTSTIHLRPKHHLCI